MSFEEQLLIETKGSDLNFKGLLQLIDNDTITIYNTVLSDNLYGLARSNCIYINILEILHRTNEDILFFVILHEIAHYKRIVSVGEQYIIDKIVHNNYKDYVNWVIDEEIFADRYGRLMFYKLNDKQFPINKTQELENKNKRVLYSKRLKGVYQDIKVNVKTIGDYEKLLDKFVVHVR